MNYPQHLSYHDRPLMVFETPDGDVDGLILDEATGKFVPATDDILIDVAYVSNTTDVITRNRDGFILQTERIRSRSVSGVGPAFDLYRQVEGIWDTAKSENRLVTDDELARIDDIHRRTFVRSRCGRPARHTRELASRIHAGWADVSREWRKVPANCDNSTC